MAMMDRNAYAGGRILFVVTGYPPLFHFMLNQKVTGPAMF
jgi:hypothetical protein